MLPSVRRYSSKFLSVLHRCVPGQRYKSEPEKPIISTSFHKLVLQTTIHLVPVGISIAIISRNIKGQFLGFNFTGVIRSETIVLLLLQLAAKGQEVLVVASLALIVFDIARRELLHGSGLPLGLLGSGLVFNNPSYFFSAEFLGSLSYNGEKRRKAFFVTLLIVAGIVAALAGPSTAVLVLPGKNQRVVAGGTVFSLPGTENDFWPSIISEDVTDEQAYCASENATYYGICPSGGFRSTWDRFGQANHSDFANTNGAQPFARFLSGSQYYWTIQSPHSHVPSLYTLGSIREGQGNSAFQIQSHAATAIMLERISADWWRALKRRSRRSDVGMDDFIEDRFVEAKSRVPITSVRCSVPQQVELDASKVAFPTLPFSASDPTNFGPEDYISMNISLGTPDHLRFRWMTLPMSFGPATAGAVFESAWNAEESSKLVVGCTVQSTWHDALLNTDLYSFWTGWYPHNVTFDKFYPPYQQPTPETPDRPANGRIAVGSTWMEMLTPATPREGPGYYPWEPNTMESILTNAGFDETTSFAKWTATDLPASGKTRFLETIIATVFNDGLSRLGSHRLFNTTVSTNPSLWTAANYLPRQDFDTAILRTRHVPSSFRPEDNLNTSHLSDANTALLRIDPSATDITTLRVAFAITGFAYQNNLAGDLAMSILLIHIALAIAHLMWIWSRRQTSESWGTISEYTALAQNSHPAYHALENTGAGIKNWRTFSRVAKIRISSHEVSSSQTAFRPELVFLEDEEFLAYRNSQARNPRTSNASSTFDMPSVASYDPLRTDSGFPSGTASSAVNHRMPDLTAKPVTLAVDADESASLGGGSRITATGALAYSHPSTSGVVTVSTPLIGPEQGPRTFVLNRRTTIRADEMYG